MFHRKKVVSASIALFVMLSSAAVYAANDGPTLPHTSSSNSVLLKSTNGNSDSLDEGKLWRGPGDPVAGQYKATLCFGCHGEDGNSLEPLIPKLSGQFGIYIAKQVRNYQLGQRNHQIMGAIAVSVNDDDLADIAAYFASQPIMSGSNPSSNKVGKNLFENGDISRMVIPCNNCHGMAGKGKNARNPTFPVIGGQNKDYLFKQLADFKKGDRQNSPNAVMNITVQKLSPAELDALADYISGL